MPRRSDAPGGVGDDGGGGGGVSTSTSSSSFSASAHVSGTDGGGGRLPPLRKLVDGLLITASTALSSSGHPRGGDGEGDDEGGDGSGIETEDGFVLGEIEILLREEEEDEDEDEGDAAGGDQGEVVGRGVGDGDDAFAASDPRSTQSRYGRTDSLTSSQVRDLIGPDLDGGLVYTSLLLPDGYDSDPKRLGGGLEARDYDVRSGGPKPRRKMPFPVTVDDFFSSLVRIGRPTIESHAEMGYDELWDSERTASASSATAPTVASLTDAAGAAAEGSGGVRASVMELSFREDAARWIFTGTMNGWPGLTCMELRSVDVKEKKSVMKRNKAWKTVWRSDVEGNEGSDPAAVAKKHGGEKGGKNRVRAVLRSPEWSAHGWSKSSPGFLFWVERQAGTEEKEGEGEKGGASTVRLTYGTDILRRFKCPEEDDPLCDHITMVCHRYATGKRAETSRDKLTYHSLALLEWDHRRYCTVVEIGYLNGLSGYKGKSNWFDDKDDPAGCSLYAATPPEMVLPWRTTMSEIRCIDVPARSLDEFKQYMVKYEGRDGRFVDVRYPFSHQVRLSYRSRRNIATYLLNYIRRDRSYNEMRRNCQTFMADLCGFLAGKKDVQPFHPINQIQYTNQKHKFLYESSKYAS